MIYLLGRLLGYLNHNSQVADADAEAQAQAGTSTVSVHERPYPFLEHRVMKAAKW